MHLKTSTLDHHTLPCQFPLSLSLLLSLSASIGTLIILEDLAHASPMPTEPGVESQTVREHSFASKLPTEFEPVEVEVNSKSQDGQEASLLGDVDSDQLFSQEHDWNRVRSSSQQIKLDHSDYATHSDLDYDADALIATVPVEPAFDADLDLLQEYDLLVAQFSRPSAESSEFESSTPAPANITASTASPGIEPPAAAINADPVLQTAEPLSPPMEIAQTEPTDTVEDETRGEAATVNLRREPVITLQGVYLLEGDESSARARLSGSYAISPNVLIGTTLDLTTGDAFADSEEDGFDLNELYVTVSPPTLPNFRVVVGMIDLTSYFDRNSFAKDAATQFINPVFQTNPALAAAGIGSRPGILVNWDLTDHVSLRGATFSSDRDLDDFAFDGAAAEIALRTGNLIVRGTYVTDRDAGQNDGFQEIFQFDRGDEFGLLSDDRETAYGINAEWFVPELNLGFFGRYGWYENQALNENGNTYSFGINALDLFFADDRLGLGYGRALSNNGLRRDRGNEIPDVLELFYDARITPNLRAGVILQGRDAWSETVLGLRIRADLNFAELGR